MHITKQLQVCKTCIHRKTDFQLGLLCGLTDKKADFEETCPLYVKDEAALKSITDDKTAIDQKDISNVISPESLEKLRSEQKLIIGIVSGAAVGIIGAILWGLITVATGYQIGYMALAIGAGVGISIRKFGKGVDKIFGYWGAAIALLSCILGNFFSIIGFIAEAEGLSFFETLSLFDYSLIPDLMAETFSIIDILFYGIAIYEGYRFSFRVLTQKDVLNLNARA